MRQITVRKRLIIRALLAMVALFGAVFIPLSSVLNSPVAAAAATSQSAAPVPDPQYATGPVGTLPGGSFPPGANVIAELPGLRTATSRSFLTATGSHVLMSYAGPVNYKDAKGAFQPIDDTALPTSSGGGWHNTASSYHGNVPSSLANHAVTVSEGSATLGFTLKSASAGPVASPTTTPPTAAGGSAKGATVSFSKPLPETDISYAFGNSGVDETVSLASATAPTTYSWTLAPSAGLTASMVANGSMAIKDASGTVVFIVASPSIKDANNLVGPAPVMTLAPDGVTMSVSMAPDAAWLADPARAYPVAVDPSVIVNIPQSYSECMLIQSVPNTPYCQSATNYDIGYNGFTANANTMFRFDNLASVVPYDSLVQTAFFSVYENGALNGNPMLVSLNSLNPTEQWSPTTATWNDYNGGLSQPWVNPGGDYGLTPEVNGAYAGVGNGWLQWAPVKQVQAWVNGEDLAINPPPASTNEGFMLTATNQLNTITVPNWLSSPTTYWPSLSVQYTPRIGTSSPLNAITTSLDDKTTLGVNAANGDLSVNTSLFNIANVGPSLNVGQAYDSMGANTGSFGNFNPGAAWSLSSSFDQPKLMVPGTNPGIVDLLGENGANAVFTGGPLIGQYPNSPPGLNATLTVDSSTTMHITFHQSGEVLTFTKAASAPYFFGLTSIKDRNGNTTTYNYDASGTVVQSVTDAQGRSIFFGYNPYDLVTSITDSTGRQVTYSYTTLSAGVFRLASASYGGFSTYYGYDANGNLNEFTSPAGNITTMTYDGSRRVLSTTRVTNNSTLTGDTTTYAYTPGSAASPGSGTTKVTNPNGNATTYSYDPWDQVGKVTDALGHDQNFAYNPSSDPVKLTDALTQVTALGYDNSNNLNAITSPGTTTATASYNTPASATDNQYLPSSATDASSNCSSFSYDSNGNQTSTTSGLTPVGGLGSNCDNGTGGSGSTPTTVTNTYQTGTSGCGAKIGELCTTTSGLGHVTTYGYDSNGNVTSVVQPGGSCTLGSRSLCTTITYDALSRPITVTDGKGQTTTYSYDSWDRITQLLYNGTSSCNTAAGTCIQYGHDADGNVTSRIDSTGTTVLVYDTEHRLVTEELPGGANACLGSFPYGITYTYDASSNLATYCDGGGVVRYAYDAANNNIGVATDGGSCTPGAVVQPCTTYAYNADSQKTGITYPSSTGPATQSLIYTNGKLSSTAVLGSTYYEALVYNFGTTNMQQSVANYLTGVTTSYIYDTQNRLTNANTGNPSTSQAYIYDADGNLNYESLGGVGVATLAYNQADQLCWLAGGILANPCAGPPAGSITYSYDANGNQVATSNGEAISYNAVNQTTSLTPQAGAPALTMAYTGTDSTQRTQAGTTSFTNNVFGVATSTTAGVTTYFTYNPDGSLSSILLSGHRYYAYGDGFGSVAGLIDSSGAQVAAYSYDPYGNTTSTGAQAAINPFRFKSGYLDSTNYYKFGTRFYDAILGSWTQQDSNAGSVQDPAAVNRYPYAGDNPLNFEDPSGRNPFGWVGHQLLNAYDTANQAVTAALQYIYDSGVLDAINLANSCVQGASGAPPGWAEIIGCVFGIAGNLTTAF